MIYVVIIDLIFIVLSYYNHKFKKLLRQSMFRKIIDNPFFKVLGKVLVIFALRFKTDLWFHSPPSNTSDSINLSTI